MTDSYEQRLLRFPEVQAITGLSRQTIWRRMASTPPQFPRPLKFGRVTAWDQKSITEWMQQQITERDARDATATTGDDA